MNYSKALLVKESPLHGVGVFTTVRFNQGDIIFETDDYESHSKMSLGSVTKSSDQHIMEWTILRWLNHGCAANCEISFDGNLVRIVATAPILPMQELLCDYLHTEKAIPLPFVCNCGQCNGVAIAGSN